MDLKKVTIAAGIFFACLLTLTYSSRSIDAKVVWLGISILLIVLATGFGRNKQESLAATICTISATIDPVYGFLIPYTGMTLSIASLLSTIWLFINSKKSIVNSRSEEIG
jgi:hypothetical protein